MLCATTDYVASRGGNVISALDRTRRGSVCICILFGIGVHESPTKLTIVLVACLTLLGCQHRAEKNATSAAQSWLSINDAGQYPQSWTAAAPYLERAAAQPQWEASMNKMRKPLGNVLARRKKSAAETTTALGDSCVVIQFDTSFEHKQSATETVTVMPENDGQWKVAGYFIQ